MTMQEMYDTIVEVSARVRDANVEDMYSTSRVASVVEARSIAVFWLTAAGFETDDIVHFAHKRNAECINKIKRSIEDYWVQKYHYRECIREVGKQLHDKSIEIDNPFDMSIPLEHIRKITHK